MKISCEKLFLLICVLFELVEINLSAKIDNRINAALYLDDVPSQEAQLKPNQLYMATNADLNGFQKPTTNLLITCLAKFNCTKLLVEESLRCGDSTDDKELQIKWLRPRQIAEQEYYESKSSRTTFTTKMYAINGLNAYIVKSQMNISDVGAIHNGTYICTQDLLRPRIAFDILVRGLSI